MPGEKRRVLLVDDEPNILVALEFLMSSNGFAVEQAANGQQALEKAISFQPHLIILDVMMPGIDGLEVAKSLRSNPEHEHTKIVFLTAKGTNQDRLNGYANGGEAYVTKPFDNDQLLNLVTELIDFR